MSIAIFIDPFNHDVLKIFDSPEKIVCLGIIKYNIIYISAGAVFNYCAGIERVSYGFPAEWLCEDELWPICNVLGDVANYSCPKGSGRVINVWNGSIYSVTYDCTVCAGYDKYVIMNGRIVYFGENGKMIMTKYDPLNNGITEISKFISGSDVLYIHREHIYKVLVRPVFKIDPEPYLYGYKIIDRYFVRMVPPMLCVDMQYNDITIICVET